MKNKNDETLGWYMDIIKKCPILYKQYDNDCDKTCMCWGFECSEGWRIPLDNVSCKLEALNLLFYSKYGIRIQADQVKEKYGTLHFYFSVIYDGGFIRKNLNCLFEKINRRIRHINYELKNVCVKEESKHTEVKEVHKIEYLKHKHTFGNCSNVKHIEKNGKYFIETETFTLPEYIVVPKKHKFIYKYILPFTNKLCIYTSGYGVKLTHEQDVIYNFMTNKAHEFINKACEECYNTCEMCGTNIGTHYSPRCETQGWIKYICDKCAEKLKDTNYIKNGALFNGTHCIMTKKQIDEKEKAYMKSYKKKQEKYKQEEQKFNEELKKAEKELSGKK